MEKQESLTDWDKRLEHRRIEKLEPLIPIKNHLESETKKVISLLSTFVDPYEINPLKFEGRPPSNPKDIVKCLLVMNYRGMSYRRAKYDFEKMKEDGIIESIPERATINKYMRSKYLTKKLEGIIQTQAICFIDSEDTLVLDSTWISKTRYTGGHKVVHNNHTPGDKCRKIHLAVLKESKIIACAKTSNGTAHDSPFFKHLVGTVLDNGFYIREVLADAGYSSKENYAFCYAKNVLDVFIDFRSNSSLKRAKGPLWKTQLTKLLTNPTEWKKHYRYRPIIEGVINCIKTKFTDYLRSKTEIAMDNELLLKAVNYNFGVIARYIE